MAGKIQKQDIKTEAELISGGGTAADLPNDTQIYVTSGGINKTLDDAISGGDFASSLTLNNIGGTLGETKGGTNQTTYATGDTLYASGVNTLTKLPAGINGQVLTLAAGIPSWATPSGGTGDIKSDGSVAFAANQSMGGFKLTNLGTPTIGTDAVTKDYSDSPVDGTFRIVGSSDATKKLAFEVDNSLSGNTLTVRTSTNQNTATLIIPSVTGTTDEFLTIKSQSVGIVDKRFDTTAANPNRAFSWYFPDPETFGGGFGGDPGLDGAWNAIFFNSFYPRFRKGSNQGVNRFEQRHLAVETISTSNITLSGEQTINGVLTSSSRILVAGQSTASQNGLYKTGSGSWARIGAGTDAANTNSDGSISEDYYAGLQIYVNGGTYVNTIWYCTTTAAITLGTTSLSFKTASPVTYEATSAGGAATETLTFTGLAAGDTILSVSQRVDGGNGTPILGWANQTTNALDVTWTADPTAGAIVRIAVLKA